MKRFATLLVTLVLAATLAAQTIQDATVVYSGMEMPACRISLPNDKATVSAVLDQRLNEAMLQITKSEGYMVAFNQSFTAISSSPVDFFAKVEEQGKKSSRVTVLTVFARTSDPAVSQEVINSNVRAFLAAFPEAITRYEARQKMEHEQQVLQKAQKQQAKAVAAAAAADKAVASQQAKIEKKEQAIAKQQEKIEAMQAKIARTQEKVEKLQRDRDKLRDALSKEQTRKSEADQKVREADESVRSSESDIDNLRRQAGQ